MMAIPVTLYTVKPKTVMSYNEKELAFIHTNHNRLQTPFGDNLHNVRIEADLETTPIFKLHDFRDHNDGTATSFIAMTPELNKIVRHLEPFQSMERSVFDAQAEVSRKNIAIRIASERDRALRVRVWEINTAGFFTRLKWLFTGVNV